MSCLLILPCAREYLRRRDDCHSETFFTSMPNPLVFFLFVSRRFLHLPSHTIIGQYLVILFSLYCVSRKDRARVPSSAVRCFHATTPSAIGKSTAPISSYKIKTCGNHCRIHSLIRVRCLCSSPRKFTFGSAFALSRRL